MVYLCDPRFKGGYTETRENGEVLGKCERCRFKVGKREVGRDKSWREVEGELGGIEKLR